MRRRFFEIGWGNRQTGQEHVVRIYLFDLVVLFLGICTIVALRKNGSI